jgi:elongation factor Ts
LKVAVELIKEVREKTGAGVLEVKKILEEVNGDVEKAIARLRELGFQKAEKKVGREARQGLIASYVHQGRIGVLVEVNCETDFVARTDEFQKLAREIALQVASLNPKVVRREDLDPKVVEEEKNRLREQARREGKREDIIERVVEGRMNAFYKEHVLLEQEYFREPGKTVEELIKEGIARLGENIQVRRFVRFVLGEE